MARRLKRHPRDWNAEYYQAYRDILLNTDKPWCWICGRDWDDIRRDPHSGGIGLQRVHLSSGSGGMRRTEDIRAIVLGCGRCHANHVHRCGDDSSLAIDDAHMLYVKQMRDPDYWDPDYLSKIWFRVLPTPRCLSFIELAYEQRRSPHSG